MKKTTLIHSAWVKPMRDRWYVNNQIEGNLWLYALSVHYAKSVGANIILHTDSEGEKIFGILPYDNIYCTLNGLDKHIHHRFWAAGKMIALENSPLGYIHIDGDVFIKNVEVLNAISFKDEDIVIQNREHLGFVTGYKDLCYEQNLNLLRQYINNNTMRIIKRYERMESAYNTGIFGFKSESLKCRFLDGYWNTVKKLCSNRSFISKISTDQNACPDIILEQMHLYSLCRKYNAKVKSLFKEHDNIVEKAIEIGYTHVIGKEKYTLIYAVKKRLQKQNPELYSKVLDFTKTL